MNDFQRAAEILTHEANRTKDLIAAAEALGARGSLEQSVAETETRLKKLQAEEEATKQRIADANSTAARSKEAAKSAVDDANRQAELIVEEAKAKAAVLTEKAARASADAEHEAARRVSALNDEITALATQRETALKEARAAEKSLADARTELDAFRRKLG